MTLLFVPDQHCAEMFFGRTQPFCCLYGMKQTHREWCVISSSGKEPNFASFFEVFHIYEIKIITNFSGRGDLFVYLMRQET